MQLFEYVNNEVTFSPQALEIKPFRALWDRDKSKDKKTAISELAFIYYYSDYRSIYANITNEDERAVEICKTCTIKEKPDDLIYKACDFYIERQNTISMELLRSARKSIKKIEKYFDDVDFTEEDEKGKLKYDITKTANILGNISKITEGLAKLESDVQKEIESSGDMKGSGTKKLFEDGI